MSNYGDDFECVDDIAIDLRLARDEDVALAESLIRRLQGQLWYSQPDGFDLFELIGTANDANRIVMQIRVELAKDERVLSADFEASLLDDQNLVGVLYIQPRVGSPFRLTIEVDALTGRISAEAPLPLGDIQPIRLGQRFRR